VPANYLFLALRLAAALQIALALFNFFLTPIMKWQGELAKLSLLVREVFKVHSIFIAITVGIFGVLTWRFSREMASANDAVAVWLAASIGFFWLVRALLQWTHYSPTHWRGNLDRTLLHLILFFGYGAFATVYLLAAFSRFS